MSNIGYKKCRNNLIVKLRVSDQNNEMRASVKRANKKFAKFRCSQALVLDIYDLKNHKKFEIATSIRDENFHYTIGQVVDVSGYNKDINCVCTAGIHYYLSEEAAINYNDKQGTVVIEEGDHGISYNSQGSVLKRYTLQNGVRSGECIVYTNDGKNIYCKYNYEGEKRVGKHIGYWPSGALRAKCAYKNGKFHGRCVCFHDCGEISQIAHYKDGKLCGVSTRYDTNGIIGEEAMYEDDKKNGIYTRYYRDGTKVVGAYKDGKGCGEWITYNERGEKSYASVYKNGQ